jgi:Cu2+-exporting ATPase
MKSAPFDQRSDPSDARSAGSLICDHCLLPVTQREAVYVSLPEGRKVFCCTACRAIYRMIIEEGCGDFYRRRDWKTVGIPEALKSSGNAGSAGEEAVTANRQTGVGDCEADLIIDGIRCASCVWLNEKVLERTPGVTRARVNFATNRAHIVWDGTVTTLGVILRRLRSIGYLARPYTAQAQEKTLRKQTRDLLIRFGTAAFFSMQLMMLSFGLYAGYFQGIDPASKQWLSLFAFLAATPVLFYSGWPFFLGAWRGLRNRTLNMDVLIALGASSAYGVSLREMLARGEVYFDTTAMIVTLVLLGRLLEHGAKRKASHALTRLLALQPQEARLMRAGERVLVPVSAITSGDLIEVRPGEKIPLDGRVRDGTTEVDESLVTGESRPVDKHEGSFVIGGTLNGMGTICLEVTGTGQDTMIARIARLVESAQAASAPIQRVADSVSAYFVPAVVLVASATFLYWSHYLAPGVALQIAVSVLVIACPCALGLATPVAIVAGTGKAAKQGILVKGGDVLEELHRIRTVVFDKTGTLTTGRMTVSEVTAMVDGRETRGGQRALLYAASAEEGSEHLLGKAIVEHAKEQGLALLPAGNFTALPGLGARAEVDGEQVFVGKKELLEGQGIAMPGELAERARRMEEQKNTVVYVAKEGEVLGLIALRDAPRRDATEALRRLRRENIETVMITGDNEDTARSVAREMGVESLFANVLPEGKAREVEGLRKSRGKVAMVGDGINDAPALAAADVGIAMATGSDIAMESADIVLMRPALSAVADAVKLSRKTFRVVRQNLFWAFFYNVVAIPLAVMGLLHPIIAAGAMAMSSVSVVANSLRLR